jgi:transcriptional regulator with XRE-family HTH domain
MTLPPKNTSGSSSLHEARVALGRRLRELRSAAGMSGAQLAESLAWAPSKVSKLENARQAPTNADIRGWTRATNSEHEAEALLVSLHTLEVQYAEWQRQLKGGLRSHQQEIAEINARTRHFRAFESTFIPGLLQTAEYARFRCAQDIMVFKVPNDINEAVAARMQRQAILYQPDKRFQFVLTEATLRYRLCPPEIMIGQLDRLISFTHLPNVKVGIIAFEAAYPVAPAHGFWILDSDRVMIETFSAELNLAQPQEVSLYTGVFDSLAGIASYGRSARAIISRIIEDLAPQAPEDSA